MTVRIQLRRGTSSEWTTENPVLGGGEIGYETDTKRFKFGDESTAWNELSYDGKDDVLVVDHGLDENVLRPIGAPAVHWRGAVEPLNARPGDVWYKTFLGIGGDQTFDITDNGINYRVHVFEESGDFEAFGEEAEVEYLIVAGGGGGAGNTAFGNAAAGGGGAGGLLEGSVVVVAGTQNITVGSGGPGRNSAGVADSGTNSVVFDLTALGGGGGGLNAAGGNGGSGGGARNGAGGTGLQPASASGGFGSNGQGGSTGGGGGGGGADAAASTFTGNNGGNGGAGRSSSITGEATIYAGGGGGSSIADATAGLGGSGGGGDGAVNNGGPGPTAGTDGLGGGGGGGGSAFAGANGGDGIVILRYRI